ncbi:hypothetical protein [Nannocystis pusilla]|uniref:hypothetical protein n=1 Tax=Nannocystis pusilla TaxID=889268 RepID=UPI003B7CF790
MQAFSLHNFHLGFGRANRPWDVHEDIGNNGETVEFVGGNEARFRERGFAGTIVTQALAPIVHRGVGPGVDLFALVDQGLADLPDNPPPPNAVDNATTAFQWNVGDLAPGAEKWVGIAAIHRGDPFAGAEAETSLDAWIDGVGPQLLLARERGVWADLHQDQSKLPDGLAAIEVPMLRQAVAMLHMGQVLEDRSFAREWLSQDGEPRRTRFPGLDDDPAVLPAWIKHHGRGGVLASLPPGEWTYSWIRDGAYATAAMAALGMQEHAKASLGFYLDAEAGRFQQWSELQPYAMPPYQISLVRYYGFGVEETDFNAFGPNLEFDGFGLFLWALRAYEVLTGDTSLADERWEQIATKVADVLVALVDPETGMIRADSSIWETHWLGRQRRFTYTSITAARACATRPRSPSVAATLPVRTCTERQVNRSAPPSPRARPTATGAGRQRRGAGDRRGLLRRGGVGRDRHGPVRPAGADRAGDLRRARRPPARRRRAGLVAQRRPLGPRDDGGRDAVGQRLRQRGVGDHRPARVGRPARRRRGRAGRRADRVGARAGGHELLHDRRDVRREDGVYKFNSPMLGFGAGLRAGPGPPRGRVRRSCLRRVLRRGRGAEHHRHRHRRHDHDR